MIEKLSLSELQNIIRDALYISLPDNYWIMAEISEVKENYAGHCYLELIEKQPDDKNVRARIRATIWSNRYRFLRSLFLNATGDSLREGMKILVKAKVEYHEIYGLSLNITDIDPSFTMGEMAIKRQMVIRRLEEEGVFSMNQELDFPVIPQRIAIISSSNAAGYADFINQLKRNSPGYVFYTALFEAAMQGSDTEESVVKAFDRIAGHQELFDAVAIIRGGGSVSDLSWFDSYKIAYYITQFPLPVIAGIGHEKDVSVTDLVAWRTFKTPTATADFLVECMADAESRITELRTLIADSSRIILEENRHRLESSRMKLLPVSRLLISELKERLNSGMIELISLGKDFLTEAGFISAGLSSRLNAVSLRNVDTGTSRTSSLYDRLKSITSNRLIRTNSSLVNLESSLKSVDPHNVLKRGYTITTLNGAIVKRADLIVGGEEIETIFSDGKVKSRVLEKTKEARLLK